MSRPLSRLIALAVGALSIAGSAAGAASADVPVTIAFRAYQPATTTVSVGETVVWHNSTLMPHTVTAVAGAFDSGRMNGGTSFSFTFLKPGNFLYACTIHPSMKGTVIVRAAGSAPPTLSVHLSARAAGGRRSISVTAPRPGDTVVLEQQRGGRWHSLSRARLSSAGNATLSFSAAVHRPLRVVVAAVGAEARLISATLHP